jgi:Sec1-binding region of Mso1
LNFHAYILSESDDDTPDNTHTQRALAQYYLTTEGALPSWLTPPSSLSASGNPPGSHRGSHPNVSSGSGSSTYRSGNKPVSLQDIYDSAVPTQPASSQSRVGRNQDLYTSDQTASGRQVLAGDRLRSKLRPPNLRPSGRPGSNGDQDADISTSNLGGSGYSGRSGFGGGDDYDPYNYQRQVGYDANKSRDSRQGQYSGGLPNRPGGRR